MPKNVKPTKRYTPLEKQTKRHTVFIYSRANGILEIMSLPTIRRCTTYHIPNSQHRSRSVHILFGPYLCCDVDATIDLHVGSDGHMCVSLPHAVLDV